MRFVSIRNEITSQKNDSSNPSEYQVESLAAGAGAFQDGGDFS
jgi:hypothetical protein